MNEEQIIETTDLYYASFLHCMNCKIVKTYKSSARVVFVFNANSSIDYKAMYYANAENEIKISACVYSNAIKNLKTFCYVEVEDGSIKTPDLYFAAFLHVKGCEVTRTEREGSKVIFTFKTSNENIVTEYFNEIQAADNEINPIKYANSIKNLKSLCYVKGD